MSRSVTLWPSYGVSACSRSNRATYQGLNILDRHQWHWPAAYSCWLSLANVNFWDETISKSFILASEKSGNDMSVIFSLGDIFNVSVLAAVNPRLSVGVRSASSVSVFLDSVRVVRTVLEWDFRAGVEVLYGRGGIGVIGIRWEAAVAGLVDWTELEVNADMAKGILLGWYFVFTVGEASCSDSWDREWPTSEAGGEGIRGWSDFLTERTLGSIRRWVWVSSVAEELLVVSLRHPMTLGFCIGDTYAKLIGVRNCDPIQ